MSLQTAPHEQQCAAGTSCAIACANSCLDSRGNGLLQSNLPAISYVESSANWSIRRHPSRGILVHSNAFLFKSDVSLHCFMVSTCHAGCSGRNCSGSNSCRTLIINNSRAIRFRYRKVHEMLLRCPQYRHNCTRST